MSYRLRVPLQEGRDLVELSGTAWQPAGERPKNKWLLTVPNQRSSLLKLLLHFKLARFKFECRAGAQGLTTAFPGIVS